MGHAEEIVAKPCVTVHVIDVGQGLAVVVDFGLNRLGILDCGGASRASSQAVYDFIKHRVEAARDLRILFLLVSHLDLDHIRALAPLLGDDEVANRVERVYCNDLPYRHLWERVRTWIPMTGFLQNRETKEKLYALRHLGLLIAKRSKSDPNFHVEVVAPEGSDSNRFPVQLKLHRDADIVMEAWAPSQALRDLSFSTGINPRERDSVFSGVERDDWNSASTVITITSNGRRVLFAGDATHKTWSEVLSRASDRWTGVDLAIAWHHGARLGDKGDDVLDAKVWSTVLRPAGSIVCISNGAGNPYGHPHEESLKAIGSCQSQVFCTERRKRVSVRHALVGSDEIARWLFETAATIDVYEENLAACCGSIEISLSEVGAVSVRCSAGDYSKRLDHEGCCIGAITSSKPGLTIIP